MDSLIFGILRSVTIALNGTGLCPDFTISTPDSGSPASSTSYPAFTRMRRTDLLTSTSSSTISTLPWLIMSILPFRIGLCSLQSSFLVTLSGITGERGMPIPSDEGIPSLWGLLADPVGVIVVVICLLVCLVHLVHLVAVVCPICHVDK